MSLWPKTLIRKRSEGHALQCKGGIINTRHPGQVSPLYRGLCETVGLLTATRLVVVRSPLFR
jgi:hypothetical protein